MSYIIAFIIGALSYRVRGGAFNEPIREYLGKPPEWEIPNSIIRGQWAIVMALLATACTGNIYMLLTAPLWFLGVVPGYFGGEFDLKNKANRKPKNYARLALRGAFIGFPYFLVTANGLPMALGAMLPIAYLCGIFLQNVVSKRYGFTQYGEAIVGGLVALGVAYG